MKTRWPSTTKGCPTYIPLSGLKAPRARSQGGLWARLGQASNPEAISMEKWSLLIGQASVTTHS